MPELPPDDRVRPSRPGPTWVRKMRPPRPTRSLASVVCVLVAVAATIASPAVSQALEVVAPVDGQSVGSVPLFSFDFVDGSASIELSRSPDLKTVGDDAGRFVDAAYSDLLILSPTDPLPGSALFSLRDRVASGAYFWHARLANYTTDEFPQTWTPTRRLVVKDEPPLLEGFTIRADRVRRTSACARRVRVRSAVAWSDNEVKPTVRWVLKARTGRAALRGRFDGEFDRNIDAITCAAGGRLAFKLVLVDDFGQQSQTGERMVVVRRSATDR